MVEKIKKLLKDERVRELIAYFIVGVLTTIVAWGAKFLWNFLFYENTAHPDAIQNFILSTVNWLAGTTFGFFTNRKYVFKSHGPMLKEAITFALSRLATYFMDIAICQILGTWLGVNVYVTTIISSVVVVVCNYIFSKLFVFKKKKEEKTETEENSAEIVSE